MRKLVWFALGFGAACGLGSALAPELWLLPMAAGAVLFWGILMVLQRRSRVLAAGAVTCLGLALGLLWFCVYDGVFLQPARQADGKTLELTLQVESYPVQTDYGCRVDGTVFLEGRPYGTRLYLQREEPLQPGDQVQVTAQLRLTTHGGDQEPTYHRGSGIFLLAYARDEARVTHGAGGLREIPARLRRAMGERLEELFSSDVGGFAQALLLGEKSGLSDTQRNQLSLAGMSHIVAVSGMHLSILFGLVYVLTFRQRVLSALLGIPIAVFFAAVAGFTPSVTRAALMLSLALLARLLRREYDSPSALAFAVLALLLWNPLTVASVSFQLSVGAVAGILCFSGRLYAWMTRRLGKGRGVGPRLARALASSVAVSLGATVWTAPLAAWTFGTVSLLSPLTNLLVLWAVSLGFYGVLLACALSFVWLPLGQALAWCTAPLLRLILGVGGWTSGLPLAGIFPGESPYLAAWVGFALVLLGVFLWGKCRGKKCFALALSASLVLALVLGYLEPRGERFRVTVLDVGQGQCILLQTGEKTYVVDCGGPAAEGAGEKAARHLLTQGRTCVDGLILTHFDEDHVSGVKQLLERLPVERVYMPNAPEDETCADLVTAAGEGACFVEEDLHLVIDEAELWIFAPLSRTTSNESGLSVLFTAGECDTLITGDMNQNLERRLLATHTLPDIELLVAGHHGAKSSTGTDLLDALRPEVIAVSVGANSYGHPAPEMLERAAQAGCQVFRTDEAGTLMFRG